MKCSPLSDQSGARVTVIFTGITVRDLGGLHKGYVE